ncbi:MAG: sialate O-acetylesterase [Bacteroidetes bacterium]|nr:sialate O-acetylesterase [Bacteroidota bacterium]
MRVYLFLLIVSIVISVPKINAENQRIEIPSIFSDNMVLQQNANAPIWGEAIPGTKIIVNTSWGFSGDVVSDKEGKWQVNIKTPKAGGPFQISVSSDDTLITYKNVMTGEVWLCSGQSNMEMPLMGWPPKDLIEGAQEAIKKADYPDIRFFTVQRAFSNKLEFNCSGKWEVCSSASASAFSATAFFFGKKLQDDLKIPIGLIHSSWGGTPAEAWTNGKSLEEFEPYKETMRNLKNVNKEIEKLENWLDKLPVISVTDKSGEDKWKGLDFSDLLCAEPDYNDSKWKEMTLPRAWETTEVGNYDGVIWFRKKIQIPDDMLNKNLILELGPIDDMDVTFVNGKRVGGYDYEGQWQVDRVYNISSELNNQQELTIAARVMDTQGGGGIWGPNDKMKIYTLDTGKTIPLVGAWKYLPVAEFRGGKFFVFGAVDETFFDRPKSTVDYSAYTPSLLYNAMINPLIPFLIKGAIWYQGESNTGRAKEYESLFPLMIKSWRTSWGIGDFPFYFTQIAPYKYSAGTNSQLLREAQLKSLSVPNTGMAVTLDIGNPDNIHPANKKDVGERLAFWALAKDYNKKVICSGPLYKSIKIDSNKIILSFDYAVESLVVKPINGKMNFQIAGDNKNFIEAEVKVEGKKLIAYNQAIVKPVAVRYAWSDTDEATLFNSAGLPASSFRTDDWE